LRIGSTVRKITSSSGEGESSVLRVPLSATTPQYLTTQAYKNITWSVGLADSTGAPLEGEIVNFNYWLATPTNLITYSQVTNNNSIASGIINLGVCYGNNTSDEHYSYQNGKKSWWITDYNYGGWSVTVPNAFLKDDLGIGADPEVSIGYLCTQTLIRSEY
jgi:hypothetical protein